jgi:hypothetical protein
LARRKAVTLNAAGTTVPIHEIHIGTDQSPTCASHCEITRTKCPSATKAKMQPDAIK